MLNLETPPEVSVPSYIPQESALTKARVFIFKSPKEIKILVGVLLLVAIGVYPLVKLISTYIYEKDYEKYKVFSKAAFTESLPPRVSKVTLVKTTDDHLSAFAEIKNENLDLSVRRLPYTFHFFDSRGKEETTQSGVTWLEPQKSIFVVASNVISGGKIARAELEVEKPEWQKKRVIPTVPLGVENDRVEKKTDPHLFEVTGDVVNRSVYTVGTVIIQAYVKDRQSGQVIAVSQTTVNTLKSGERRNFNLQWPDIDFAQDVKPEFKVFTNALNAANLTSGR